MVVDGARQLLADAFTISPSYASIQSASAVLDASNYTVQAIAFSKDSAGFSNYAHAYNPSSQVILEASGGNLIIAVTTTPSVSAYNSTLATLPSYPSPLDTQLEPTSNTSGLHGSSILSSLIAGNGQNLNIIPYRAALLGSLSGLAPYFGCYPEGSSVNGTRAYVISGITPQTINLATSSVTNQVATLRLVSLFNSLSSMDTSGFITQVSDSTDSSGRLITSSTSTFSSTGGEVSYIITVSGGASDGAALSLYGGVYTLGLYSINVLDSIRAGGVPPLQFAPINNPRKYRLFAKKSFTQNIFKHQDKPPIGEIAGLQSAPNLRIVWKIGFN